MYCIPECSSVFCLLLIKSVVSKLIADLVNRRLYRNSSGQRVPLGFGFGYAKVQDGSSI